MNFLETNPSLEVPEAEYKRLLGLPPEYVLESRVAELADWARTWFAAHGTPWLFTRSVDLVDLSGNGVRIENMILKSSVLHERFKSADVQGAVLVAASAGPAAEEEAARRWRAEQPDEYFFLETYASAVVEHLITLAGARLCDMADRRQMVVLPHYSPGYPGWDLTDQHALEALLRKNGSLQLPRVEVLPSGQLQPKKSQLALFGLAPNTGKHLRLTEMVPCRGCSYSPCQYRRAPYRQSDACVDGAPRLPSSAATQPISAGPKAPLRRGARYAINQKALDRWAKTRLRIELQEGGLVQAHFRYDGSTCTNAGKPLAFDYTVWLSSPGQGYRILKTACSPAADDTGNEHTCSFLQDHDEYLTHCETPPPLVGRPLNDALNWNPPIQASGCLCNEGDRNHKWRLVLNTLHYHLAHV